MNKFSQQELLVLPSPDILGSPAKLQSWFNRLPRAHQIIFMRYVTDLVGQIPLMKRDDFFQVLGQELYGGQYLSGEEGSSSGGEGSSSGADWGSFAGGVIKTAAQFGASIYNTKLKNKYEQKLKQMEMTGNLQTKLMEGHTQKKIAAMQNQTMVDIQRINSEALLASQAMRYPIYKTVGYSVVGMVFLFGGILMWKLAKRR